MCLEKLRMTNQDDQPRCKKKIPQQENCCDLHVFFQLHTTLDSRNCKLSTIEEDILECGRKVLFSPTVGGKKRTLCCRYGSTQNCELQPTKLAHLAETELTSNSPT